MLISKRAALFWSLLLLLLACCFSPILLESVAVKPANLAINEMMVANHTGLTTAEGEAADWIELVNRGPEAINLAGWFLTDDPARPEKWPLPELTLAGGEYLLIFASGQDRRAAGPGSELHTNFKLSREGEFLGLYSVLDRRFAHIMSPPQAGPGANFPAQQVDVSYGYDRRGNLGYFSAPTPGAPNPDQADWLDLVQPVEFSRPRGLYEEPFTLVLSSTTAAIRYTTDGSPPTENHGQLYTAPLSVTGTTLLRAAAFKPGLHPSPVETRSYLFLADILAQPPDPPGFSATWGGYKGVPVPADYELDPEIVNDPLYRDQLKASFRALPSLSLVTGQQSFHDLYANPRRRGRAWERPVSVELIDPHHPGQGFQVDAGLRMHGELGRSENIPKHPFRLVFRREYGPARLDYPLFPGSPQTSFDTLILRSGVNRSYAGYTGRKEELPETTYTRDEWLRRSQLAMSGFGARGRFVHLYLNGLYWGLYNLVERPDPALMAATFGGPESDWEVVDHDQTLTTPSKRFQALHHLVETGDFSRPEDYAQVQQLLDVPHFIDYLILNWASGNLDWGFNNWFAGVPASEGPIRYFVWDGERTWFEGAEIYMEFEEYLGQPNLVRPLLEALLENPDFKILLADRLYRHLSHEGALSDAQAQARWLALNREVEAAILAESARWGDSRFEPPLTPVDWLKARDGVLAQMEGNAARMLELAREAGYYPSLEPPRLNRRPGPVPTGFKLVISAPGAAVYYTTDGSDPRLAGTGAVAPAAQLYQAPLVLTTTLRLKARALAGEQWSALHETVFTLESQTHAPLQLTELMYNPDGGEAYEFIELQNTGPLPLDPSGFSFEGIDFTFPAQTPTLAPGELIVLVRDPAAFAQRYPGVAIGGVYQKNLSNSGETLRLLDSAGHPLLELTYGDDNGWPTSPDGHGDSLVLRAPTSNPTHPHHWRASTFLYGSPGAVETPY